MGYFYWLNHLHTELKSWLLERHKSFVLKAKLHLLTWAVLLHLSRFWLACSGVISLFLTLRFDLKRWHSLHHLNAFICLGGGGFALNFKAIHENITSYEFGQYRLNNGTQPVQIADQLLPCNSVLQFLSFLDSPHFLGLCYLLALSYGIFSLYGFPRRVHTHTDARD